MHNVSIRIGVKTWSADITDDTYEFLRDGSFLRRRPIEFFLFRIVTEYGDLTEENILRFMDEKWVL